MTIKRKSCDLLEIEITTLPGLVIDIFALLLSFKRQGKTCKTNANKNAIKMP